MKNKLILLFLALSAMTFAQQRTSPLVVPNKNTKFLVNLSANSLIILADSNKEYRLKIAFTATDSMNTIFRRGSSAYATINDGILLYAPITTVTFPGFGTTHTLSAYGDHAHSGVYAPISHTQAFSTITITPTTLAGYGITDASGQVITKYTTVSGNTTYTSVVPANYILDYIIIQETAGKKAVLDLGTTASGNDVLNAQTITASSIISIPVHKVFNLASTAQTLYLNDVGGGSLWNSASLTLIYVLRKIN